MKNYISFDRHEEIYEVVDNLNQTRFITQGPQPNEWLEVEEP